MIEADATKALDGLASRLTARAAALATARAEARAQARRNEDRWRRADFLWPLFAKG